MSRPLVILIVIVVAVVAALVALSTLDTEVPLTPVEKPIENGALAQ
ncbi:hypothetical protein [Sphingomonas sp. ID0503]